MRTPSLPRWWLVVAGLALTSAQPVTAQLTRVDAVATELSLLKRDLPGDVFQNRCQCPLFPQLPVVREGESVGLIAHALQKFQPRRHFRRDLVAEAGFALTGVRQQSLAAEECFVAVACWILRDRLDLMVGFVASTFPMA